MISAGILLYRRTGRSVESLLAHPGGPFWAKRDEGAWSIPKGEVDQGEDLVSVAWREFEEEVGTPILVGSEQSLGLVTLRSGKVVHAWACEGDMDATQQRSNTFTIEWPPRSGQTQEFPEVDRVDWFPPDTARRKLNPAQAVFIDRLLDLLDRHR